MNKQFLLKSVIIVIVAGALAFFIATAAGQELRQNYFSQERGSGDTAATAGARLEVEQQILKSTVRIVIQTWVVAPDEKGYVLDDTLGHATLMGERYLVTHNHFNVPLSIRPQAGDPEAYGKVFLFNTTGEKVYEGPLSDFVLVKEDVETLVFAYKEDGLFEKLGFAPAKFVDWSSQPLEPGMEVAQVDWDGITTRVDWVTVQEVNLDNGTPRLVLADGVLPGASGGGIFLQGAHVANNWQLNETVGFDGSVVEAISTVALNSAEILNS